MKIKNIILLFLIGVFMSACAPMNINSKEVSHMAIKFKPLARKDFKLINGLEVETTLTGKLMGAKKVLDKKFIENPREGKYTKANVSETMYFAPGEGETITGNLYDNSLFNNVSYSGVGAKSTGLAALFQKLMGGFSEAAEANDPTPKYAYYDLLEKYPEVDYFVNVRFDRKLVVKGKNFTEVIIVKADGIKLITD